MDRINKFKAILWIILGISAAVAINRFLFGLGTTTNMSDNTPWGFWIGFDVMGGVALAAGGFVIAAFNYIFGKKEFHGITRAAILTAFLGYLAVVIGLLFDLGLPWNIWHMIVFWNPASPLFEVGWCVMLYLSVLFLEFAPVIFEKWPNIQVFKKLYKFLNKIKIPLVITGIMLSTLHQSSLGSLFLAMPYKLHPLWYSPVLPIIFFVSAIMLGMNMVMLESMSTSWLYRRENETNVLNKLRKYALIMLIFYLLFRFVDIYARGAGELLFDGSWEARLFWTEIGISVIIPLILYSLPYLYKNVNILYIASLSAVFGVVLNRLNVGGITHINNIGESGQFYLPSITELSISAGVVSLALLLFFFFIENFKVWEEKPSDNSKDMNRKIDFESSSTYFGPSNVRNRSKFSFLLVVAFAFTFASFSGETLTGEGYELIEVSSARGKDTLFIDGNRDGFHVAFPHEQHKMKGIACSSCHHMNKPEDQNTSCSECHSLMYTCSDAFNHDWHTSSKGGKQDCFTCHDKAMHKSVESLKHNLENNDLCVSCHENMFPQNTMIKVNANYKAASYTDAMHNLCIKCHDNRNKMTVSESNSKDLTLCSTCHKENVKIKSKKLFKETSNNKWVIVPAKIK